MELIETAVEYRVRVTGKQEAVLRLYGDKGLYRAVHDVTLSMTHIALNQGFITMRLATAGLTDAVRQRVAMALQDHLDACMAAGRSQGAEAGV